MVCTIRVQVIIINFCIHTFTVVTHLCICKFYLFIFRCLHITLTWLTDNVSEVQVYSWLTDCLVARGCTGALPLCAGFSSGGERGLFWVAVHRLPAVVAPLVAEHRLRAKASVGAAQAPSSCGSRAQHSWSRGSVALRRVESPHTRDRTCVPCTGRPILIQCTAREVMLIPSCFLRSQCKVHLFQDISHDMLMFEVSMKPVLL